jgi:MarR family 2-MHQ and catechol resistance regulon transcriptional repressor
MMDRGRTKTLCHKVTLSNLILVRSISQNHSRSDRHRTSAGLSACYTLGMQPVPPPLESSQSVELDEPGKNDKAASLQLILSIGRSFKYVDDYVRPRMQKLGLTMTEFSVLSVLYHHGPTPLGELSQRILLTGASTTYTVKKLEQRGLLTRRPLDEDHRVVMGSITNKGRKQLDRIFPLHTQHLVEAMSGLSAAEKKTAAALLRKMQSVVHAEQ